MVEKEWKTEPDEKTWTDKKTGFRCHIKRHLELGHLCGYVGVPRDHPLWGRGYGDLYDANVDIRVHGGITFSDTIKQFGEDIWWFGFDCAHAVDISPYSKADIEMSGATYRNMRYVRKEVRCLAEQLDHRLKWLVIMGPADRKIQEEDDD
jgi:hypothetical protein